MKLWWTFSTNVTAKSYLRSYFAQKLPDESNLWNKSRPRHDEPEVENLRNRGGRIEDHSSNLGDGVSVLNRWTEKVWSWRKLLNKMEWVPISCKILSWGLFNFCDILICWPTREGHSSPNLYCCASKTIICCSNVWKP